MPSKNSKIVFDGYCFVSVAHRVTVTAKGKTDEEELAAIIKLYEEHYVNSRKGGPLHKGKWQWCPNVEECKKAVYAPFSEIEKNKGKILCSHYCANKVRKVRLNTVYSVLEQLVRKKQKQIIKDTDAKKERLLLSEDEIDVLLAYQKNDSIQVLTGKTKKPGGKISVIIDSILIKSILIEKEARTLEEAKEIFKNELIVI
ncbi:MAG: hypothetical protein ABH889_00755 [Candidatus Portnoybacteria bacterium]